MAGGPSERAIDKCRRNPGHPTYYSFHDFDVHHLPDECQSMEVLEYVRFWAFFAVKLFHIGVSFDRPETFPGSISPYPYFGYRGNNRIKISATGMIDASRCHHVTKTCPCSICKYSESPEREYWTFIVHTSTFNIYDDFEASRSHFECFYFDDSRQGIKHLYGLQILPSLFYGYSDLTNRTRVLSVTHDRDLAETLLEHLKNPPRMKSLYKTNVGVILSFPHDVSLKITVGRILDVNVGITMDNPVDTPILFGDGSKYSLTFPLMYQKNGGQEDDDSGIKLQAGIHLLPDGMTFSLPTDAGYCHRFDFMAWPWFTFPPGTQFRSPTGKIVDFPPDTKFSRPDIGLPLLYVTYDIDTCPGSSGASLLMDWGGSPLGAFRHLGIDFASGNNRSGSQFYVA